MENKDKCLCVLLLALYGGPSYASQDSAGSNDNAGEINQYSGEMPHYAIRSAVLPDQKNIDYTFTLVSSSGKFHWNNSIP